MKNHFALSDCIARGVGNIIVFILAAYALMHVNWFGELVLGVLAVGICLLPLAILIELAILIWCKWPDWTHDFKRRFKRNS